MKKAKTIMGVYDNEITINDYSYIVYAKDKVLSGWGNAQGCSHWQVVLLKDDNAKSALFKYFRDCNEFTYISTENIENLSKVLKGKKSFSVRTDWVMASISQGKLIYK